MKALSSLVAGRAKLTEALSLFLGEQSEEVSGTIAHPFFLTLCDVSREQLDSLVARGLAIRTPLGGYHVADEELASILPGVVRSMFMDLSAEGYQETLETRQFVTRTLAQLLELIRGGRLMINALSPNESEVVHLLRQLVAGLDHSRLIPGGDAGQIVLNPNEHYIIWMSRTKGVVPWCA